MRGQQLRCERAAAGQTLSSSCLDPDRKLSDRGNRLIHARGNLPQTPQSECRYHEREQRRPPLRRGRSRRQPHQHPCRQEQRYLDDRRCGIPASQAGDQQSKSGSAAYQPRIRVLWGPTPGPHRETENGCRHQDGRGRECLDGAPDTPPGKNEESPMGDGVTSGIGDPDRPIRRFHRPAQHLRRSHSKRPRGIGRR